MPRTCLQIVKDFLDAQGLQEVLSQSLVNIHTAPYEAYGMTIVEAAACGKNLLEAFSS